MLKNFLITYADSNRHQMQDTVIALDMKSAVNSYVYTHPNVSANSISCIECADGSKLMCTSAGNVI